MVCRFKFKVAIGREAIEERIAFAITTAECTFGPAKVRLNAAYLANDDRVVIDVSSQVGEFIAEVFTGWVIKELGEQSFTVERIRDENCQRTQKAVSRVK